MAYCRFSTDRFKCDVYVYASAEGYTIHTAGNRIIGEVPPIPGIFEVTPEEWQRAHRAQMEFIRKAKRELIENDFASNSFVHGDAETTIEQLEMLRAAGFRFPDNVLEALRDEMKEELAAAEQRNNGADHEEA